MTADQFFLFALLVVIFALFLWGRVRYDVVAFGALIVAYLGGAVPNEAVFAGFGHPATVIIALVLIISQGLYGSGAIEVLTRHLVSASRRLRLHIAVMAALGAALSAVMNNVAALALLMPVDMQAARKAKRSPALTLMPLSFASILGGMVTLIGYASQRRHRDIPGGGHSDPRTACLTLRLLVPSWRSWVSPTSLSSAGD